MANMREMRERESYERMKNGGKTDAEVRKEQMQKAVDAANEDADSKVASLANEFPMLIRGTSNADCIHVRIKKAVRAMIVAELKSMAFSGELGQILAPLGYAKRSDVARVRF